MDVAEGHISAVDWMNRRLTEASPPPPICEAFNYGTGRGTTVFELVAAFERASGRKVPLEVGPRRAGDLTETFCNPAKAKAVLGWEAKKDIDRICVDSWRWQERNPKGYEEAPDAAAAAPK